MRDLERGRIFRLTPDGHKGYKVPVYDFKTPKGAVEALKSPNLEARYLAWTALHSMGKAKATPALEAMMKSSDAVERARAAWCGRRARWAATGARCSPGSPTR